MTAKQAPLLKKARDSSQGAKLLAEDGLYDFAASLAYCTMLYSGHHHHPSHRETR
jgi:uncharacterized protein (UPF0332 family)